MTDLEFCEVPNNGWHRGLIGRELRVRVCRGSHGVGERRNLPQRGSGYRPGRRKVFLHSWLLRTAYTAVALEIGFIGP